MHIEMTYLLIDTKCFKCLYVLSCTSYLNVLSSLIPQQTAHRESHIHYGGWHIAVARDGTRRSILRLADACAQVCTPQSFAAVAQYVQFLYFAIILIFKFTVFLHYCRVPDRMTT